MNILVIGGDKRQHEIIRRLDENSHQLDLLGLDKIESFTQTKHIKLNEVNVENYDAIILPVTGVGEDLTVMSEYSNNNITLPLDFFVATKEKCLIFTGIKNKKLDGMITLANRQLVCLMGFTDVAIFNSIPTTEGIIMNIIQNTDYTIHSSNIMVLGYGNIGKTLTRCLKALGANLSVVVNNDEEIARLTELKINPIHIDNIKKHINKFVTIVNTIPALVINREVLNEVNKDAYILDVASLPGGVDFKWADHLKIKNCHFLGIPAEVAPKTAGKILCKKIDDVCKGEIK